MYTSAPKFENQFLKKLQVYAAHVCGFLSCEGYGYTRRPVLNGFTLTTIFFEGWKLSDKKEILPLVNLSSFILFVHIYILVHSGNFMRLIGQIVVFID